MTPGFTEWLPTSHTLKILPASPFAYRSDPSNLRIQVMHVLRNTEARSCNHCCSAKAINITHSEGVFVALGIQHALHKHRIAICGLPGFTIFFHIVSQMVSFSKRSS